MCFCTNAVDLRLVVCGADGLGWFPLVGVFFFGWSGMEQRVTRLETNVDRLQADVAVLKQDVSVLKQDVAELKKDMREVKIDVAVLKTDVAHLKQDMSEVKTDLSGLRVQHERDFRILFGAIIFVALGMSAMMAKGFGWFH